ncbi:MAG: glycosyltransferase [Candidatus Gastranaerophilaceae bacterium]
MVDKQTKVSIIMPVSNADKYLQECLESVVNQSLRELEIICINDASKDNSIKILEDYSKKDKRIKIINLKEKSGQGRARNIGVEKASGEYIGFVDADDYVDLTMFEKMYTSIFDKKADIAMCRALVYNDKTNVVNQDDAYYSLACFNEKFFKKTFTHFDTTSFWDKINVAVWNKLYRAEFLKSSKVNFPEGYIYEDVPFFYATYTQAKKVVLVEDSLYFYRINSQNSTMTKTDKNVKDRVDMLSLTFEILKKQTYFKDIQTNVVNWLIHDLFYRCLQIDSRYQKEYFFRMQKFFKTINTAEIDDELVKSPYYSHFCEIRKRNYDDCIKYFFNQESLCDAYVEMAKKAFEKDYNALSERYKKVVRQEEENIQKKYDLEDLQDKILQEEKNRWADFEAEKERLASDYDKQKEELDKAWQNLDAEKQKNVQDIEKAWDDFKKGTDKRTAELDELQERILQDEKERWAEFEEEKNKSDAEYQTQKEELDKAWQNLDAEKQKNVQDIEKAWDDFKKGTDKRTAELDELQERILQDEKERWAEFEEEKNKSDAEYQTQKEELDKAWQNFELEKQKIEQEAEKNRADFEEEKNKKEAEYQGREKEIDDAWEQYKEKSQEREKQLNTKQEQILKTEKELWNSYEKSVKELENEKQRQRYRNKIAIEKVKNNLNNKFFENIAEEKKKLCRDFELEMQKERENYSDMLQEQIKIQQENYEKINSFKKKIEETRMNRPKVSVILPVYNVAPYLRQSLDSIIGQTLRDIEIICVDDGSTDESGKILDEYKGKDSRIKVVHKKNAGTGAARNDGLKLATGECIGFVDPDDWILPNMYERLYEILQEKQLDIVMFTPDVFNDKTKKHEGFLYFQNSNFPDFLDNKIFNKDDISPFSYPMCVWNKLYTKKLFDENNIDFAEGLDFEDHKVIFKSLFTAKRIYFIREKLYVYRHSREGSILSDNDTRMFDHIKIYDIVENILKETGNWEKFHLDFLRYKVHNILYYYTMIKPQYKKDYYDKMAKSLQMTKMNEEEFEILSKDYPDLKPIMEDTLANKIKTTVKKLFNK